VLLKRLTKYVLAALLALSGLTGKLLRHLLLSQRSALILGYHGVSEGPDAQRFTGHTTANLAAQLRFLKRHLRPAGLDEIVGPVSRGEAPPAGAFAVTFDDGLVSNAVLAVPLLRELGLSATFFVPSALMGGSHGLWVSSLREILAAWPGPSLPAEPGLWPTLRMADETSRWAAYFRIKQALKLHQDRQRELLDRLAGEVGGYPPPPPHDRVVDAKTLRAMSQAGFGIGAHSRTHPILARLEASSAREEIETSRREIEALLGRPVLDFAYPNGYVGDFDETTCRLVAEAGYRCALTTEQGTVRHGDDRLALRRCLPGNVPLFVAGFDLLLRAWNDRGRAEDLGRPLAERFPR
jgi:peptidoglycan/xylan/chitin deacetylase (PgdA/CDA1 family)